MKRSAADYAGLEVFHPVVQSWFRETFPDTTRPQSLGWSSISSGESTLILSPTGSGKTLAAFLVAIDRLMFSESRSAPRGVRLLYISPLKALAVDVERNLQAPLAALAARCERDGIPYRMPQIAVRTGDTPSRERAAFARKPTDILITTPESLFLLLTSAARDALRSVDCVILDEIHTLVASKRGAHLALSLERLEELVDSPFQRVGLSATQRPLQEVATFLGGFESSANGAAADDAVITGPQRLEMAPRPVRIVDAGTGKKLDLHIQIPAEEIARRLMGGEGVVGEPGASIWSAIHPFILDLIQSHRSTLIFVNSRRLAERMANALNELAGSEIVHAHHGSIAREKRLQIEEELKSGTLSAMVATSSLELGIDMGAIDLVVQVEAPPSVASGIQRIGRAGHQVGASSTGIILPKFRGDLLSCAAVTRAMLDGAVEESHYLRRPLDVLAQQIVAMVAMEDWSVRRLEEVVRQSAPFVDLPQSALVEVLDMLSGRYPSDDFAELKPRITWDRRTDNLRPRDGAKRIAIANAGTIPDRGLYGVFLAGAPKGKGRVGELDEEMVFESKVGDKFLLGASAWRVEEITDDRVLVSPAPGSSGRMPFWHGDSVGRPIEFGRAIGALARTLRTLSPSRAIALLKTEHGMDESAAQHLLDYLDAQEKAAGAVPDDRTILIESARDEMGDWRVCVLTPFGARVHAPWAMAIGAMTHDRTGIEPDVMWTDDGIVVRFPDTERPPDAARLIPLADDVEDLVIRQLTVGGGGSRQVNMGAPVDALFASRFREAASRALLLPRKHPGHRSPLWQRRKRAADLLKTIGRFGSFPIVHETFREILKDVFDMPALVGLLRQIESGEVHVVAREAIAPSPFAASLLFHYVANFLYEGDAPIAERRAQALLVDPLQLHELLGDAELRELLDPEALDQLEMQLQRLTPERTAESADDLHDLLRRVGDLTEQEILARTADQSGVIAWLQQLEAELRVIKVTIAGEERRIAVEDAARYRDALGTPIPDDLPAAYLEPASDALGDLISRFARTHGPFAAEQAARRFGIGVGPVRDTLRRLAETGRVVEGAFLPGGSGAEWCDRESLRMVRQRSLARLRQEIEPVEAPALGRLLLSWNGITEGQPANALIDVIMQLQDCPLPASALETQILPARLKKYDPREFDQLLASGALFWVGCGSLGRHDGRVRLLLAEDAHLLLGPPPEARSALSSPLHCAIREHLQARGASFFPQLLLAVGGLPGDLTTAIWDLVWAGEITNDTLEPLRGHIRAPQGTIKAAAQRAALARRGRTGLRSGQPSRSIPQDASGRWSLVSGLRSDRVTPTEHLAARTDQLLERYGILTRETIQSEGIEGGFAAVYPVLRALEDAGRIRRGYFVAGLGALQFALPGAVDRLRALRDAGASEKPVLLAATDPANPYGSILPWPERPAVRRPARSAGATVILLDGAPAAWLAPDERALITFLDSPHERSPADVATAIAEALASLLAAGGRRALLIEEIDGSDASSARLNDALLNDALLPAGFTRHDDGYQKRI